MCSTCATYPSAGLLAGRTVLVTGVLRPSSVATAVAATALGQGARVVLTGVPRTLGATRAVARRLGVPDPVVPLDVADPASLASLVEALRGAGVERLDGVVHCLAHAEENLLGSVVHPTHGSGGGQCPSGEPAGPEAQPGPREVGPAAQEAQPGPRGVGSAGPGTIAGRAARIQRRTAALESAFTVSAASLPALTEVLLPLMGAGSAVVALTFDSARVHPGYGWMGPLKAALEAGVRSLAAELGGCGVRVNAVSAGPLRTPAALAVPGLEPMISRWQHAAPLGWDPEDASPVARGVVALLSGWLPATTGQVVYADGGAWLTGA